MQDVTEFDEKQYTFKISIQQSLFVSLQLCNLEENEDILNGHIKKILDFESS